MNEHDLWKLLKQHASIDGDGNVIGDGNEIKEITQKGGDRSILLANGNYITISLEDLRHILPPLQRRSKVENFVNRSQEISELLDGLKPGEIVTRLGPGGIGKTALVVETLWRLTPHNTAPELFPDGIVYCQFQENTTLESASSKILSAFGEEKLASDPTLLDAAERVLSGRQALLVLDATENIEDILPLLNIRGRCCMVITSRDHSQASDHWKDVTPLDPGHAVELLAAWSGKTDARVSDLEEICLLIGCLPLAIRLVGQYIQHRAQRVDVYLVGLRATPLAALEPTKRQSQSITLLLDKSIAVLDPESKKALAAIGLLANSSFDLEVIAEMLGCSQFESGRVLGQLVNLGFLFCENDRYHASHALIHTYAREKRKTLGIVDDQAITDILIDHFYQLAKNGSPEQIALEEPHCLAALQMLSARRATHAPAACNLLIDFVDGMDRLWDTNSEYQKRVAWLSEAYKCAQLTGKPLDQADLAQRIARVQSQQGHVAEAMRWWELCENALGHMEDEKANKILAFLYIHRASTYCQAGNLRTAEDDCRRGIEIARIDKQPDIYAEGCNLLGVILGRTGRLPAAMETFEESLRIWKQAGEHYQIARVEDNICTIHFLLGNVPAARQAEERIVKYWQQFPNRIELAMSLTNLGLIYYQYENYKAAVDLQRRAMEISDHKGVQRMRATTRVNLAWPLISLHQYDVAETALTESIDIQSKYDTKEYWIEAQRARAEIEARRGHYSNALNLAYAALNLAAESDEPLEKGAALRILGQAFHSMGNIENARNLLKSSLSILQENEFKYELYLTLKALVNLYQDLHEMEQMQQASDEASKLLDEMGLNLRSPSLRSG